MLCSADRYPHLVALLGTFLVSILSVSQAHAIQGLEDLPTGFFENSNFKNTY